MPARILMLGLDGADPGLLARWCADGSLPAIQALQSRGRSGRLSTPRGLGDDAAWPCFYTGRPVGTHGRYFWKQLTPDGARLALSRGRLPAIPPFWSRLAADKRIAIIDVPTAPLARGLNGFQLCDWLVHGRDYSEAASFPPDLAARVVSEFGAAPPSLCSVVAPDLDDRTIRAMSERLCQSVAMKIRATCHHLAGGEWDLLVAVFKEAHCASHMLWHLADPTHPDHRPEADFRLGQPLKAVYRALDRAVGEVVAAAGPQASILLFSPLGMSSNVTGNHLMEPLARAINRRHRASLGPFSRTAAAVLQAARPRRGMRRWRQPYTFCRVLPHNEVSGALRLNVIGRDRGGMVEAGAAYEALCRQLAEDLGDLREAATGRRVVAGVVKSHEVFAGPAVGGLPDLFIVWERSGPIGNVISSRYGPIAARPEVNPRPGNHVPGGCYMLAGPAELRWQAGDIDICELARLFLEAAGVKAAA